MNVQIVTNYGRLAGTNMPYVPRVGESIRLTGMNYMYDERNGKSPEWIVTKVEANIGGYEDYQGDPMEVYEGVSIYIKNKDDE